MESRSANVLVNGRFIAAEMAKASPSSALTAAPFNRMNIGDPETRFLRIGPSEGYSLYIKDGQLAIATLSPNKPAGSATDTRRCRHKLRLREKPSGFASPETTCVECGQSFDHEEEHELRHRDQAAQRDSPWVNAGKGYLVG